ncbi:MAG: hypothetical protein LH619_05045 [Chitinophagaceae bacterium]|nr:hypothetical protein [Chitinophagaceae bacterium]
MKRFFAHAILFAFLQLFLNTRVTSQNFSNYRFFPNRTMLNFSCTHKANRVELKGLLSASHTYDKIVVEKGSDGTTFSPVQELSILNNSTAEFPFSFIDNYSSGTISYYRIRLLNTTHFIQELSSVLMVKTGALVKSLELQNTLVRIDNPVLNISAVKTTEATINMFDMSGKIVFSKKVKLNTGLNSVSPGTLNSTQSFAIVTIETPEERSSTKVILQ